MKNWVKKTGNYFLFFLTAVMILGLALNITGCCLNLQTQVTSSTDTAQQTQPTAAGTSDSVQTSQQTIAEETTATQTEDTTATG